MSRSDFRLICLARDVYPLNRADIAVLFGEHLSHDLTVTWCVRGAGSNTGEHREKVGKVRVAAGLLQFVRMHLKASREILSGRYDGVQCRDLIVFSAWYALLAVVARVPFIYWMSFPMELGYLELAKRYRPLTPGWLARTAIGKLGKFLLRRFTLPRSRLVFVQSDLMAERVADLGIPKERLVAVPMGFDPKTFRPDHPEARLDCIPEDGRLILYVGALDKERALDIPFKAVCKVLTAHNDVHFAVAGNATAAQKIEIEEIFNRHEVFAKCHFLGSFPPKQLCGVIQRASVCLSPVPNTPMFDVSTPTKLVEYSACGRRSVVNFLPDHERVAAATGFCELVPFTEEGFRDGIERALSKGEVPAQQVVSAMDWLLRERSYEALAKKCRHAYGEIAQ